MVSGRACVRVTTSEIFNVRAAFSLYRLHNGSPCSIDVDSVNCSLTSNEWGSRRWEKQFFEKDEDMNVE